MSELATAPRIANPDEVYAEIMDAVRGLDAEASLRFCARLAFLLANHIGDETVVREAIRLARESGDRPAVESAGGNR